MARGDGRFKVGAGTTRVFERIRASVGNGDPARLKVLAVACPACGVKEEHSCLSSKDQLRWSFHAERHKAARAAAATAASSPIGRRGQTAAPSEPLPCADTPEARLAWIRSQMRETPAETLAVARPAMSTSIDVQPARPTPSAAAAIAASGRGNGF